MLEMMVTSKNGYVCFGDEYAEEDGEKNICKRIMLYDCEYKITADSETLSVLVTKDGTNVVDVNLEISHDLIKELKIFFNALEELHEK